MSGRFSDHERKIEQSLDYMLRHLDQPLQAATLASMASLSLSHYFALFKRMMGCAPIDYFIRLRMRHACHLLTSTSLNIKEVAAALGYDDPFYFSRVFKSINGVPPSDYRAGQFQNGSRNADGSLSGASNQPEGPGAETWKAAGNDTETWIADTDPKTQNNRILHGKQNIVHSAVRDFCHAAA